MDGGREGQKKGEEREEEERGGLDMIGLISS